MKKRQDLTLAAVRKICCMQKRKGGGRQQAPLLSAARCRLHQRRRIPLREMDPVAANFQPPLQQIQLGAFPRAVDTFHHHQRAGVGTLCGYDLLWSRLRREGYLSCKDRHLGTQKAEESSYFGTVKPARKKYESGMTKMLKELAISPSICPAAVRRRVLL